MMVEKYARVRGFWEWQLFVLPVSEKKEEERNIRSFWDEHFAMELCLLNVFSFVEICSEKEVCH